MKTRIRWHSCRWRFLPELCPVWITEVPHFIVIACSFSCLTSVNLIVSPSRLTFKKALLTHSFPHPIFLAYKSNLNCVTVYKICRKTSCFSKFKWNWWSIVRMYMYVVTVLWQKLTFTVVQVTSVIAVLDGSEHSLQTCNRHKGLL